MNLSNYTPKSIEESFSIFSIPAMVSLLYTPHVPWGHIKAEIKS